MAVNQVSTQQHAQPAQPGQPAQDSAATSVFDVIVVGGGAAGAVVAQVLTASLSGRSVLVIESGPDLDPTKSVAEEPANSANLFVAQSDGRRKQPPQAFTRTSAPGLGEAQLPNSSRPHESPGGPQDSIQTSPAADYLQGRGWGGGGAMNGLICKPGYPEDYNRWANEFGCDGWSWSDLAPTFAALQSHLFISPQHMYGPADEALLQASARLCHEDGLRVEPAPLSVELVKSGNIEGHLQRKLLGLDSSVSSLRRMFDTQVIRLLTDDRTVVGVELADGAVIQARHIIVSAGAIGSAALLLRSGIGSPATGRNLHDHVSISVTMQFDMDHPTNPNHSTVSLSNVLLESSDHIQIVPISGLPETHNPASANSPALAHNPASTNSSALAHNPVLAYNLTSANSPAQAPKPVLGVWMASPFGAINGRGSVTLDDHGNTIVAFDSFSDPRDRQQLRNAARLLADLLDYLPDPRVLRPLELSNYLRALTNDQLDAWVQNNQGSYYHAAGTCRMGPVDHPNSVVDPACAVIGWNNLSVIDASIFPDLPMANPYLPTVAVAHLAATRLAVTLAANHYRQTG